MCAGQDDPLITYGTVLMTYAEKIGLRSHMAYESENLFLESSPFLGKNGRLKFEKYVRLIWPIRCGGSTSGQKWALPPPPSPSLMVCPPLPQLYCPNFCLPKHYCQVQFGQIKGFDGWILLWR